MAYTKTVTEYTEVEIEVKIKFKDVIGYIESEGLSESEFKELSAAVEKVSKPEKSKLKFGKYASTIMDEMAADELKELLKIHGPETIMAMVKAGKGQLV